VANPAGRRILVIAPFPYPIDRGSPIRARRLVELAERAGHDVVVVTYAAGLPAAPGIRRGRVRLPIDRAGFCWQKIVCDLDLLWTVVRETRRHRPDVIDGHVHEGLLLALVARLTRPSARVVYNAHGTLAEEMVHSGHLRSGGVGYRLLSAFERWLVRRADRVLAQSHHRAAALVDTGVRPDRVVVLADGPEPGLFPVPRDLGYRRRYAGDGDVLAAYTGSLEAYQGVDDILTAVADTPEVSLVLFGSPSGDYAKQVADRGLAARVHVIDPAPYAELPALLAAADIGLSPRHYGGNVPGKVPAYLAAGLPVIATDVEGLREVVDDSVGAVVPAHRPDLLAKALRELATDAPRRKRAGEEASRRAQAWYGEEVLQGALAAAYGSAP
jgi:glycosyltransferase involved in cell wall biosynthesis